MKKVVLVGIALCTLLLISPALASDAGTLDIYGNANEDDTIDMRDLTHVKLVFFGKKTETELADAKYDGKINPLDFIQIKLIIVGKEKELTVVDSADRIVTVEKPVERIIPYYYGNLETIRSLKLEKDRIVGVSKEAIENKIFYPEFSDYPSIGGTYSPDIEKILSLNPDVVFASQYWGNKYGKKLEDVGITMLYFEFWMPETYYEEVKKLGYILGKNEEAGELIEFYEGLLSTIKEKVDEIPEDEKPRAYFESKKPYNTAAKGAGYHQKLEMAGGNNLFNDLSGYPTVDPEEVVKRNPEIIVKKPHPEGGYDEEDPTVFKEIQNEIMSRPELKKVSAVKMNRVFVTSGDIYAGASYPLAVGYLSKCFHPELFKDLNPKAFHQEYLTIFQGLDYNVYEHGVFVYPEPS